MPNLELDEATHTYTLNGRRLISVTQALSILDDRWKVDPFYLERGRLIHLATEYYDRDELDFDSLDERIGGYVNAYINFKIETGFIPHLIEHKLYHPRYFYAGRMDRIGSLNSNEDLLDLKSGEKADVDELQGSGYWELCRVNGIPIKKVFDLYLHEDGTYKLEPIERPKLLLPVFLSCLTITQWRERV
jgi:hypothetical protein